MKNIIRSLNIILGIMAAVLITLALWQHSAGGSLDRAAADKRDELRTARKRLNHLERLKNSEELSSHQKDIFLRVPVGDTHALSLAKDLKQEVLALGLDNFVFTLGDAGVPGGGIVQSPPDRLDIIPVTVTVSFEAQFPRIVTFLQYLYELKRFVNIERLIIARVEASGRPLQTEGPGGFSGGVPGMPTALIRQGPGSTPAGPGQTKNMTQRATVVLTTYTFTQ